MNPIHSQDFRLTEADLNFLIEATSGEVRDKARLRRLLREDEDFRIGFIGDERTCQKVLDNEEIFLKISAARGNAGRMAIPRILSRLPERYRFPILNSRSITSLMRSLWG